jgi:hypothetical protein
MRKSLAPSPQLTAGSSVRDVMNEPREKRPAGGADPGEPKSKQSSLRQNYSSHDRAASPAANYRAQRLIGYWNDFQEGKGWGAKAKTWVTALACDYHLPNLAPRLGEAMQEYRDPKSGEITAGHDTLTTDIGCKDPKTVRATIHAMCEAGYLAYEPGRKGVGFSRYTMIVPDARHPEDVVSREKIPGYGGKKRPTKPGQLKPSTGEKSPAGTRVSREKIPGTIYKNNKSRVQSVSENSFEGEVSLKGNPPQTNGDDGFIERPGSKFAPSRETSAKRSDASSETPASTPDRTLFDQAVEDLISLAGGRSDSRQINKARMRDELERGSTFFIQPSQYARFSQYEQAAEVLFDDAEWASTMYRLVWGR